MFKDNGKKSAAVAVNWVTIRWKHRTCYEQKLSETVLREFCHIYEKRTAWIPYSYRKNWAGCWWTNMIDHSRSVVLQTRNFCLWEVVQVRKTSSRPPCSCWNCGASLACWIFSDCRHAFAVLLSHFLGVFRPCLRMHATYCIVWNCVQDEVPLASINLDTKSYVVRLVNVELPQNLAVNVARKEKSYLFHADQQSTVERFLI